jgi:hypothetical protein
VDRLRAELLELRTWLDKSFSPDTALNGPRGDVPSAGHCAAVSAIVWKTLGGSLVSTSIKGISHWFSRIQVDSQLLDLDITGDQFGYPAVQIKLAEELYPLVNGGSLFGSCSFPWTCARPTSTGSRRR